MSKEAEVYDLEAGALLNRTMSVQLTPEQFERLYLQPGGTAARGDLTKRFGNPTPVGVGSFLLCLTPLSMDLMGFAGTSSAGAVTLAGTAYYIGGVGLYLAGIMEFILGNTFPMIVFMTFGGFWAAYGFFLQPSQGIMAAALASSPNDYSGAFAMYLGSWAFMTIVFLVASLRTNVVFVLLFVNLEIAFDLLVVAYVRIGYGRLDNLVPLLKTAGAFGFLTTLCGWYLFFVLVCGSTGIPLALPVGDLSGFMSGKPKVLKE